MDDDSLLRYSRQILLPGIDVTGQEKLLASRVLLIGLGGLGSPVAMYLAAAGVGCLVLVDHDQVDLTNLQRQVAHTSDRVGLPKVDSAAATLAALNPGVHIEAVAHKLEGTELLEQVTRADVVVDASDNLATRLAVNAACLRARKPLVSGAVIRLEGQVSVYRLDHSDSPCFRCLYPDADETPATCVESGILGPVAGIIGCIQAAETIKLLTGLGQCLAGRLLLLDASTMEWRELKLPKNPHCPACG